MIVKILLIRYTSYIPFATAAVNLIAAVTQAYYSRQAAIPVKNKLKLCKQLCELRKTLLEITVVGNEISDFTRSPNFAPSGKPKLSRLTELSLAQQQNLKAANLLAKKLAAFFDIDAPEFNELSIYISSKTNRIGVIYGLAVKAGNPPWMRVSFEPSEKVMVFRDPRKLISKVERSLDDNWRGDRSRAYDEDFKKLTNSVKPLTELIRQVCPAEYRA